jgi:hypothetical protein
MREYDDASGAAFPGEPDEPVELIRPEDFLGPDGLSRDARRLGFDRNTQEGAMLAFAGSLDPTKPVHKVVAWLLLLCFAVPVLLGMSRPLF